MHFFMFGRRSRIIWLQSNLQLFLMRYVLQASWFVGKNNMLAADIHFTPSSVSCE